MQPAPLAALQNTISEDRSTSSSTLQEYGLQCISEPAPDRTLANGDGREPTSPPDGADIASVASDGARRGRRLNAGRISSQPTSSQEGSPGSRIEAYEKANAIKPKMSGPLGFQVISSGNARNNESTIDNFPNGKTSSFLIGLKLTRW